MCIQLPLSESQHITSSRVKCSSTVHIKDMLVQKAKCEPVLVICVAYTQETSSLIVFTLWRLHHEPVPWTTQLRFMLLSSLVNSSFVLACQLQVPWEVSQSLDPGRLKSMPVKLPRSLLLILVLSEPSLQEWSCSSLLNVYNWYRGNSFGSTQLLIWPHCSSFSTDRSTLLLEVGRQVILGQHLTRNYWLSRHFLCCVWMCRVRHASQSVQVFYC